MTKYGILSIQRAVEQEQVTTFDNLYHLVGQNTGNLLFTNAVWNHIGGEKVRVGFTFNPDEINESLDPLIIPAANWMSANVDFSKLADLIERVRIPTVLIGLGAQNDSFSDVIQVPAGTQRFARAVAERSHAISVRGEYTRKVLEGLGISNVVVTGCPSLYNDFRSFEAPRRVHVRPERGLLHSTRFSADHAPFADTHSSHRDIFRLAFQHKMDLLLQSEREEMHILTAPDASAGFDERLKGLLMKIYASPSWSALEAYVKAHARLFFQVNYWSKALEKYDYVFGTRLHGTVMALNSGVPAFMLHHDSRTKELCDFAGIPSADSQSFQLSLSGIQRSIERTDFSAYYTRRLANKQTYKAFLHANGLALNEF